MRVCVLGAGIAGLSTAYLLMRAGHKVTVVDRARAAAGASGANGAQLSYSYVQPLASPAIRTQLPGLLLSPSSPLKIRPRLELRQWRWVFSFLMACNAGRSLATTSRLLALAASSRIGFDAMREREQLACDFSATGKLVLFRTEAAFTAARRQLALQRGLGGREQQAVSRGEALTIEPALGASDAPMAGAIFTPSECAADCAKVCAELARIMTAGGVAFRLGTAVTGLMHIGSKVRAVRTENEDEIDADAFVVALGAASARLAPPAIRLPLYPLKGYSITIHIGAADVAPCISITDSAAKVVFARIGTRLRVAGMAELVGDNASIPAERIETLKAATRLLFPQCRTSETMNPWTGMRPATPSGEPIVGRQPRGPDNLLFNTGHGALGFTLAFGTAQQVVDALATV